MNTFNNQFHALGRNNLRIWLGVLCGIAMLGAITSQALTTFDIMVPATSAWYDTGIFINAGEKLDIAASGEVTYGTLFQQVTGPGGTNYDGQHNSSAPL